MRIASLLDERWTKKVVKWDPGLGTKNQTNRTVERPQKRWEDEVNDFSSQRKTEESKSNEIKNNDIWINDAKDRERCQAMETDCAVAAASIH